MSERGIYGQAGFVGVAAGWDDTEGFTISFFASGSVGASADLWSAVSFSSDNPYFIEFEREQYYLEAGTPSGVPGFVLNAQVNLETRDPFVTSGFAISNDVLPEVGFYWEGPVTGAAIWNWDGVYDPVESTIREVQKANPHIPPEEVAAIVTAQVAAYQQQTPWTMLEVNPWDVIDLEQIDSLEQAYIAADGWARHDPSGPGSGGGGSQITWVVSVWDTGLQIGN